MTMHASRAHLGTALLSTKPGAPPATAPALCSPRWWCGTAAIGG